MQLLSSYCLDVIKATEDKTVDCSANLLITTV
jgi:hypothetical protein